MAYHQKIIKKILNMDLSDILLFKILCEMREKSDDANSEPDSRPSFLITVIRTILYIIIIVLLILLLIQLIKLTPEFL